MTHLKLKLIVNDTFAHVSYDKMASCLSKKYLDNFTRIAMTNSNVSFVSDKFCPKKKQFVQFFLSELPMRMETLSNMSNCLRGFFAVGQFAVKKMLVSVKLG